MRRVVKLSFMWVKSLFQGNFVQLKHEIVKNHKRSWNARARYSLKVLSIKLKRENGFLRLHMELVFLWISSFPLLIRQRGGVSWMGDSIVGIEKIFLGWKADGKRFSLCSTCFFPAIEAHRRKCTRLSKHLEKLQLGTAMNLKFEAPNNFSSLSLSFENILRWSWNFFRNETKIQTWDKSAEKATALELVRF